jgi:hypothetical protein
MHQAPFYIAWLVLNMEIPNCTYHSSKFREDKCTELPFQGDSNMANVRKSDQKKYPVMKASLIASFPRRQ